MVAFAALGVRGRVGVMSVTASGAAALASVASAAGAAVFLRADVFAVLGVAFAEAWPVALVGVGAAGTAAPEGAADVGVTGLVVFLDVVRGPASGTVSCFFLGINAPGRSGRAREV